MENRDPRTDTYIEKSAAFAQPILTHIRQLVHQACPEIIETTKWGFPHFEYNGVLCSMASFKQHCALGFWKATLMSDPYKLFSEIDKPAMGHFGQIRSLADLPADNILLEYLQEAVQLNIANIKKPDRTKSATLKEIEVPDYFREALSKNESAQNTFADFSNSNKKEYISWITEAKAENTRQKRLETAIKWLAEGKIRNWKYVKK